ncbi:MAG: hypothetical protein K6A70_04150 [Erysipelotrichaceae bacterium]|nr:hypothetical protein [Erysipelotrichaceae bacterium]
MFFERKHPSNKEVILESIKGTKYRDIYYKVWKTPRVQTVDDLSTVLTKKEYDQVIECLKEAFARQVIWYIVYFREIMNSEVPDCDYEEFDVGL